MPIEKEIALNLVVKSASYTRGMALANKATEDFKKTVKTASVEIDKMEKSAERAAKSAEKTAKAVKAAERVVQAPAQQNRAQEIAIRLQKLGAAEYARSAAELGKLTKVTAAAVPALANVAKNTQSISSAFAGLKSHANAAGQAFQGFTGPAIKGISSFARDLDAASIPMASIASGLKGIAAAGLGLGVVAGALALFGTKAIQAAENINVLKGSVAAIVAANEKVTDSSGRIITGVEKIKAVQVQVSAVFKQIQLDALKTSDTTQGLIEKFTIALPFAQQQGWNLDKTRKFTTGASVSMSALNIPAQQATSEIRALMSGENLLHSELAKGLGISGKADWSKLAEGGKLYENLTLRMKDFVAAGELQSRGLTGIMSSLQDFNEKLLSVAGNQATETLAKGFGEVLDMVQMADGSLTPFGKNLIELANISGYFINQIANDFISLAKWIVHASDKALEFARAMKFSEARAVAQKRAVSASEQMGEQGMVIGGRKTTVKAAFNRRAELQSVIADDRFSSASATGSPAERARAIRENAAHEARRESAAREVGVLNAHLKPWEMQKDRLANLDLDREAVDATRDDFPSLDRAAAPSGFKFTNKPLGNGHHAKAKAAKKNPAIAKEMRELGRDISANDAAGNGISGQIAIYQTHLAALRKIKGAEEEIKDVESKIFNARKELGAKLRDLAVGQAKDKETIARIGEDSLFKITGESAGRALDQSKDLAKYEEALLKDRYDNGMISTQVFYKDLEALRLKAHLVEVDNERDQLDRLEKFTRGRLAGEMGKRKTPFGGTRGAMDQDPAEIARLNAALGEIGAQRTGLDQRSADGFRNIGRDTGRDSANEVHGKAAAGISGLVSQAFGAAEMPISEGFNRAFTAGIQSALKGTSLGDSLDKFFGDSLASDAVLGAAESIATVIAEEKAKSLGRAKLARDHESEVLGFGPGSFAADEQISNLAMEDRRAAWFETTKGAGGRSKEESDRQWAEFSAPLWAQEHKQNKEKDLDRQINVTNDAAGAFSAAFERSDKTTEDYKRYLESLEGLSSQTEDVYFKIEEVKKAIVAKNREDIAEGAAYTANKVAESWEKASARILEGFQNLREEQERLLSADSVARQVSAIYGQSSGAANGLADIDARIALAKSQRTELGSANQRESLFQMGMTDRFGEFTVGNSTGARQSDGRGGFIEKDQIKTFTTDANTFVEDLSHIQDLVKAGAVVLGGTDNHRITAAEITNLKGAYAQSQSNLTRGQGEAATLGKTIKDLGLSKEVPYATIRQGAKDTARGLGMEVDGIRARLSDSTTDDKALAYAQIDEQVKAREKEYTQAGYFANGDKGSQTAIRKNLEDMRSLLRQQVDKDSYTESNPLPVRVVDNRQLFALPDSTYFRQKAVTLNIADGAIKVTAGSGSGPEIAQSILGQLQKVLPDLGRALGRESGLNDGRVTAT